MKKQPQLPNLLVIGAMKAGTTSLHSYLGRHPDIFMSEMKEPHFFSDNKVYEKGIDWYKNLFVTDKPFRGESSQGYTKCHAEPGVAKKIYQIIPDAKLIYIIRDPVERVLSHAVEFLYEVGDIGLDLNEALRKDHNTHITKTSLYYFQITEYLKFFPEEQLHILTLEDLKQNRLAELNRIFGFLGVKPLNDDKIFDFVMNRSDQKMMQSKLSLKLKHSPLRSSVGKLMPENVLESVKNSAFYRSLFRKPIPKATLDPDVVSILIDYFREDVNRLKAFTGRSFSNWKYRY